MYCTGPLEEGKGGGGDASAEHVLMLAIREMKNVAVNRAGGSRSRKIGIDQNARQSEKDRARRGGYG